MSNKLSDRKIKEILNYSNLINIKRKEVMAQEKVYTEGIAFDGAAILEDGLPLTISQILKKLNKGDEMKKIIDEVQYWETCPDVLKEKIHKLLK